MKILPVALCLLAASTAQRCSEPDHTCVDGYYCSAGLVCSRCVDCERQYNRLPGATPGDGACFRNVAECGECREGFRMDSDLRCVDENSSSDSDEAAGGVPSYVVCLIVVGILLVLLVLVVYVVKPRCLCPAKTRIEEEGYCCRDDDAELAPSSPPPPPYNPDVFPHASPPPYDQPGGDQLKDDRNAHFDNSGLSEDRVQRANPFNLPHYIRVGQPSQDGISEDFSGPELMDDDTRESVWTPNPVPQNRSESTRSMAEQLNEERGRALIRPPPPGIEPDTPPAKMPRCTSGQPEETYSQESNLIGEFDGNANTPQIGDLNGNTHGSNGLMLNGNTQGDALIVHHPLASSVQYGRTDLEVRSVGARNDMPSNGNPSAGDGAPRPPSPAPHRQSGNHANITINNIINIKQ